MEQKLSVQEAKTPLAKRRIPRSVAATVGAVLVGTTLTGCEGRQPIEHQVVKKIARNDQVRTYYRVLGESTQSAPKSKILGSRICSKKWYAEKNPDICGGQGEKEVQVKLARCKKKNGRIACNNTVDKILKGRPTKVGPQPDAVEISKNFDKGDTIKEVLDKGREYRRPPTYHWEQASVDAAELCIQRGPYNTRQSVAEDLAITAVMEQSLGTLPMQNTVSPPGSATSIPVADTANTTYSCGASSRAVFA